MVKLDNSKYLRNLVEFMPRRLEDIVSKQGNPFKCKPEEQYNQLAFLRPKSHK
jgi:hypothetical protein